jgi:hypothetical protein
LMGYLREEQTLVCSTTVSMSSRRWPLWQSR